MSEPVRVGHDPDESRDLYVLELSSGRLQEFHIPVERFGCSWLPMARGFPTKRSKKCVHAADAGAALFATWGPDCEQLTI